VELSGSIGLYEVREFDPEYCWYGLSGRGE
jgi:hypothetical protein